jgi:hypothetical protein
LSLFVQALLYHLLSEQYQISIKTVLTPYQHLYLMLLVRLPGISACQEQDIIVHEWSQSLRKTFYPISLACASEQSKSPICREVFKRRSAPSLFRLRTKRSTSSTTPRPAVFRNMIDRQPPPALLFQATGHAETLRGDYPADKYALE